MEEQRVRAGAGPIPSAHLGFVDATKGLGILAVIWGHMDYLWSTSSVWFSSFKLAVFFVVVGLLKARRYEARGQEESCGQQAGNGMDMMKHGVNGEFIFRKRGYGAGA